jgi:Uma2 family endonuclease
MDLGSPFQRGRGGPGGWWLSDEPELHFGEHVLVPDLGGWRRERMPAIPNIPYFELAPDWICEVLSRSTEAVDRGEKLPVYASNFVEWLWLVNPLNRTLEVLRRSDARWLLEVTHRDDAKVRIPPFDAIELALGDLWLPSAEHPV